MSESMQEFSGRFREVWDSLQASINAEGELRTMLLQASAVSEEFTASTQEVASLVAQQNASSRQMVRTGEQLEELSRSLHQALELFQKGNRSEP
jgi:methyl-accepting chemotaxis protein